MVENSCGVTQDVLGLLEVVKRIEFFLLEAWHELGRVIIEEGGRCCFPWKQ